jgi:hypothetical protein
MVQGGLRQTELTRQTVALLFLGCFLQIPYLRLGARYCLRTLFPPAPSSRTNHQAHRHIRAMRHDTAPRDKVRFNAWQPPRSGFRKTDQRLEFVTAGLAFPQMPHTARVQIFRPFRQENRLPALSAFIDRF